MFIAVLAGCPLPGSDPVDPPPPPKTAPGEIIVLTLEEGNGQLIATWAAPTDDGGSEITRYELQYREAHAGEWESAAVIANGDAGIFTYTITELTNGTEYAVRVYAVNAKGNGNPSEILTAIPVTIPSAPNAPTLTHGNNRLTATWNAPNTGGSEILRYELQYREVADPEGMWLDVTTDSEITTTSHTIMGLTNGNSYEVQVRAVNAQGNSPWSGSTTATPDVTPNAPAVPTLTVGNTQLTAAWSTPADNGSTAITGYELQYRAGDRAWTLIVSGIGTNTSHTITGLTNGNSYEVQVRAVNDQGSGPWSKSASATPATIPSTPDSPTLTAGNTQLGVAWTAPNTGGSAITRYELQYLKGNSGAWTLISSGIGTNTSHTITGLTNGNSYEVQVRAINAQGTGEWSGSSTATPVAVPMAPTAPTLAVGNTQLTVAWSAPTDTGGSAITRYELQYRTGGGAWTLISSGIGTRTSHTITGLTNGNSYEVQVSAVNDQGNSPWSRSAAATPATIPGAPDSPTLTEGNTQLTVAWTAPTDNGGTDITRYELQYRRGNGAWTLISSGTNTTHTITGLTNGNSYKVQVRAVNAQGTGEWSPSASATPVAVPMAPTAPTLTAGNTQLTVAWSAPTDTGGSAITGYELQYRTGGEAWTPILSGIGTKTNHTITGLTNGNSYEVQVRAVNAQGAGAWSGSATAMLPIIATQVPAGTAVSAILSAAIDTRIATENLTVSLTTVTSPTSTVTPPTVNAGTGIITVTPHTTAGTYLVSGEDSGGTEQFSEHFYVTVSPTTNGKLKTAVTSGISNWGNTADLNYIITTSVTDMSGVFAGTYSEQSNFNGDISDWDVSSVTDMSWMFHYAVAFNGDISDWDVSSVENMNYMFRSADAFNGDISDWDVSSVTNMGGMFYGATAFNGDISDWDVSSVTDMGGMFYRVYAFNGDILDWDVSSVTNMGGMFYIAVAFNGDISDWDVSSVTSMSNMFYNARAFNGDISDWDVSSVTYMSGMFYNARAFNGDISGWDVSSVTKMHRMFWNAEAFNGDISDWDVSSVTTMEEMFYGATAFNGDISDWDVSSVTNMRKMFNNADAFNRDLSDWDVSSVTKMSYMFYSANAFRQNLEEWKDHWTLNSAGKYTGYKYNMFYGSGVTGNLLPSWY